MRRTLLTAVTIGLFWFPLAASAVDLDQTVCDSFPSSDSSTCSVSLAHAVCPVLVDAVWCRPVYEI